MTTIEFWFIVSNFWGFSDRKFEFRSRNYDFKKSWSGKNHFRGGRIFCWTLVKYVLLKIRWVVSSKSINVNVFFYEFLKSVRVIFTPRYLNNPWGLGLNSTSHFEFYLPFIIHLSLPNFLFIVFTRFHIFLYRAIYLHQSSPNLPTFNPCAIVYEIVFIASYLKQ